MSSAQSARSTALAGGLAPALGAYLIWGIQPLYIKTLHAVPPFEFVGWRVLFSLPFCLALVLVGRQLGELRAVLTRPRLLAILAVSATLIMCNWGTYVLAVYNGHVLAASIGYYINPLLNVLLGTVFLGERLSRPQWLAVAIAATGVLILAVSAMEALWVSLVLAGTFGVYGLVRKLVPVSAAVGLTCETLILLPPAIALLAWWQQQPAGLSLGNHRSLDALLLASGPITAAPLALFAAAARRMDYSTLGFIQFIAPTLVFVEGLWLFHEPLSLAQACCFGLIWLACALYCWDLLRRAHAARLAAAPTP